MCDNRACANLLPDRFVCRYVTFINKRRERRSKKTVINAKSINKSINALSHTCCMSVQQNRIPLFISKFHEDRTNEHDRFTAVSLKKFWEQHRGKSSWISLRPTAAARQSVRQSNQRLSYLVEVCKISLEKSATEQQ